MKRRILSSLMALVLVFGLLPATAFAAGGTSPAGNTIYVDAVKGNDAQTDVGTTADKAYQSIGKAVKAAESGDTIQLAEGAAEFDTHAYVKQAYKETPQFAEKLKFYQDKYLTKIDEVEAME